MRINSALADMNSEDLNQRYSDSFVLYNNTPTYIGSFYTDPAGKGIYFSSVPAQSGGRVGEIANRTKFDWKLLDISRPQARWYVVPQDKRPSRPVYISYPLIRQWSRGLRTNNTSLTAFSNIFGRFQYGTVFHYLLKPEEIQYKKKFALESSQKEPYAEFINPLVMLLWVNPQYSELYYRDCLLSVFEKNNKNVKASILKKGFEQEIKKIVEPTIPIEFENADKQQAKIILRRPRPEPVVEEVVEIVVDEVEAVNLVPQPRNWDSNAAVHAWVLATFTRLQQQELIRYAADREIVISWASLGRFLRLSTPERYMFDARNWIRAAARGNIQALPGNEEVAI